MAYKLGRGGYTLAISCNSKKGVAILTAYIVQLQDSDALQWDHGSWKARHLFFQEGITGDSCPILWCSLIQFDVAKGWHHIPRLPCR